MGYYINVIYDDPVLNDSPPSKPVYEKLCRQIMSEEPRVTNFPIEWDEPSQAQMSTEDGFQQPGFTGQTGFGE